MKFAFDQLVPLPMSELDLGGSDIWEADHFSLDSGGKYRVIAPSGMGKTSLLSIMYGLRDDYRGVVWLDDRDITTFTPRDWADLRKYKLSFIFQGLELFDDFSALENIRLKNRITGMKSEREIERMADQLGILPFMERKCGILSFGQRQRVAIIRALCQPFEYLLADECFSHIDHRNSRTAFELISEECSIQGAGMVFTSLDENSINGFDTTLRL